MAFPYLNSKKTSGNVKAKNQLITVNLNCGQTTIIIYLNFPLLKWDIGFLLLYLKTQIE
jgi:hypothetical protein